MKAIAVVPMPRRGRVGVRSVADSWPGPDVEGGTARLPPASGARFRGAGVLSSSICQRLVPKVTACPPDPGMVVPRVAVRVPARREVALCPTLPDPVSSVVGGWQRSPLEASPSLVYGAALLMRLGS